MPSHSVAVFLKYPEPGIVKTRLAADIGDIEATRVYRELVKSTIAELPWDSAEIMFHFSPAVAEQKVRDWLAPRIPPGVHPIFCAQIEGGLGERLNAAVDESFNRGQTTVTLVGTDCPALNRKHYHTAWAQLSKCDVVFGPAHDGGYYLLALKAAAPYLFRDIPWSTSNTLAASMEAAKKANLRVSLLEPLRDVDTLADLPHYFMNDSLIRFTPIYQERVWGGRTLNTLYRRTLPDGDAPYGESWELVDREEAQSVVEGGKHAGKSLNDLWQNHREEVFGTSATKWQCDRFPILVKILDARDKLSIQVHPPAEVAASLGGEPKTEMWYIVDAEPGAELYVGLKDGVTREGFENGLAAGTTASQVHTITPRAREFIFIPSGRLHAIGAGLLIFEIQQNSDTTYRVFDWNRLGLDGNPRQLHVEDSLKCIDFSDLEPQMSSARGNLLVDCDYFNVQKKSLPAGEVLTVTDPGEFAIVAVTSGSAVAEGRTFKNGDFFVIPASAASRVNFSSAEGAEILVTRLPAAI